jgi:hypothetical protein
MAQVRIDTSLAVRARISTEGYYRKLPLAIVAAPATDPGHVATRSYPLSTRGSGSITQAAIDAHIANSLAPYATEDYVQKRDTLLASIQQVDSGDAVKLKLSQRNIANGVAGLDAGGRVDIARISAASTQRWPKGQYTPAAYPSSVTEATGSTEVTVLTLPISDPGTPYRILVNGHFDCRTEVDGDAPLIQVRRGSTSGQVIASGSASPSQYRYGTDTFNRIAAALGAGWESVYTGTGSGHVETSTKAFWSPNGNAGDRIGVFRKINDFSNTVDDYQEIFYTVADTIQAGGIIGSPPHNYIYGRMKADRTNYVFFDMTDTQCWLKSFSSGIQTTMAGPFSFGQTANDQIIAQFGYYSSTNKLRFRLIRNSTVVIDYIDSALVSTMGSDSRGWGFGMQGGASLLQGQPKPAALDFITLRDPLANWNADPENWSPAVLVPIPLSTQDSISGNTTLYVTLRATTAARVYANSLYPRLHVMAIPA